MTTLKHILQWVVPIAIASLMLWTCYTDQIVRTIVLMILTAFVIVTILSLFLFWLYGN